MKTATALAVLAVVIAAPAHAQDDVTNRTPSVRDVALTPLSDLNLDRDPIPEILQVARAAPYANVGLDTCGAIRDEVGNLDAVLGDDFDTSPPDTRERTPTGIAQQVIGMLIPYRGVIREISGANRHQFNFREAIAAGLMRRAFLKGRGQEMGCAYPARPAPPELVARLNALEANPPVWDANPRIEAEEVDETVFVSRPVVQAIKK